MSFVIKNTKGEYWNGRVMVSFKKPEWEMLFSPDIREAKLCDSATLREITETYGIVLREMKLTFEIVREPKYNFFHNGNQIDPPDCQYCNGRGVQYSQNGMPGIWACGACNGTGRINPITPTTLGHVEGFDKPEIYKDHSSNESVYDYAKRTITGSGCDTPLPQYESTCGAPVTKVESITNICIQADDHQNNEWELERLLKYVQINNIHYTNSHKRFIFEHINNYLEIIRAKDQVRRMNE